jgi:hypothetical protein
MKKNNKETKTVFKAIFAWEDEKEEQWLENMAAEGWRLESVAPFFYKFHQMAPEEVVYRLDYKNTLDKDYADYSTIFCDSGWELVAGMSNWHYYHINPQNTRVPEIYNSNRAKSQKYRRLLVGLLPLVVIYVTLFNPALNIFGSNASSTGTLFSKVIEIFLAAFLLFFVYVVIRLWYKIKKLESQSKE